MIGVRVRVIIGVRVRVIMGLCSCDLTRIVQVREIVQRVHGMLYRGYMVRYSSG